MSDAPQIAGVRDEGPVSPEGPSDDRVPELDAEARERRAAALAQIRTFGDPVLKSRASEISSFGPELEREADRMIAIMHDAIGVGLAATQLGVMHRLLVFQAGLDATPTAIVNPELEWSSAELATAEEGCLSLPRVAVDVERALYARVRGRDVHGEPLVVEDGLDVLHCEPRLVGDAHGVMVLVQLVGVLVVERRWRRAGNEQQVARRLDADGRRVGHVLDALRDGLDLAQRRIGR